MDFARFLQDVQARRQRFEDEAREEVYSDLNVGRPRPVPVVVPEAPAAWHLVQCGLVPYDLEGGSIEGFKAVVQ